MQLLHVFLSAAETSPILWEHSEGHPAQTGLLRRRLLRHGIPLLPTREYSHQCTAEWVSRMPEQMINMFTSVCLFLSRQYISHPSLPCGCELFWQGLFVQHPTWSVFLLPNRRKQTVNHGSFSVCGLYIQNKVLDRCPSLWEKVKEMWIKHLFPPFKPLHSLYLIAVCFSLYSFSHL